MNSPWEQEERRLPPSFLGCQNTELGVTEQQSTPLTSCHTLSGRELRALLASECGRGVMSPPPASPGGAVIWDSLYWGSTTGEVSFPEWLVTAGPCL